MELDIVEVVGRGGVERGFTFLPHLLKLAVSALFLKVSMFI